MNLNLAGQSIAVFGAARGIGRAIADGFVAEGCSVRGFDRESGADFITTGDVTSYEAVKNFAAGFEAVDHVVFCVGIGSGKFGFPFWNLEPSDWARVLEVNLIGAVNVAHAFAPKADRTRRRLDAVPRFRGRADGIADRSALQRVEGGA
jgi:2-hydroxycyclohexanecarboxyl-CoA dehydrogenase